jgi:DNA-binding response OmpR family regulator
MVVGRSFALMSDEKMNVSPASDKIVLIVDDDRDIGDVLQKIIVEQTNYKVVWIAESELVLDAATYLHPSLLLLDYMLPTMDGLHLYDRLQELETMRGVPTVLISASAKLPFDELRARGIYLLQKPFELSDLLDILAQFLT